MIGSVVSVEDRRRAGQPAGHDADRAWSIDVRAAAPGSALRVRTGPAAGPGRSRP